MTSCSKDIKIPENNSSILKIISDSINKIWDKHPLLLIFGIAIATRLACTYFTPIFSKDGVHFLFLAGKCHSQGLQSILGNPQHPLFPFLTSLFAYIFPSLEVAARFVTFTAGILGLGFVYWTGLLLFGKRVAKWAALFFAVHPVLVEINTDIITESLFSLFVLAGIALLVKILKSDRASKLLIFLTGISAGFAYLTRPEGLLLVAAGTFLLFILPLAKRKSSDSSFLKAFLTGIWLNLFFILGFLLIGSPYMLAIGGITTKHSIQEIILKAIGKWNPNIHKHEDMLISLPLNGIYLASYTQAFSSQLQRLYEPFLLIAKIITPISFCLLIISFFRKFSKYTLPETVPLLILFMTLAIAILRVLSGNAIETRHIIPALLCSFPYVGLGWVFFCDKIQTYDIGKKLLPFAIAGLFISLTVYSSRPIQTSKIGRYNAGKWILETYGPDHRVMSFDTRINFLAKAKLNEERSIYGELINHDQYRNTWQASSSVLKAIGNQKPPEFVVYKRKMFRGYAEEAFNELLRRLGGKQVLVEMDHRWKKKKNDEIIVWKLGNIPTTEIDIKKRETFHIPEIWTAEKFVDFCQIFNTDWSNSKDAKTSDDYYRVRFRLLDELEARNNWEDIPLLITGMQGWLDPFNTRAAEILQKITGKNIGTDPVKWIQWWGSYIARKRSLEKQPETKVIPGITGA